MLFDNIQINAFPNQDNEVKCTIDTCRGKTMSYCITCQASNPLTLDQEHFAKTFQTFPRCQTCIAYYHKDHDTISINYVSIKHLSFK